MDNRRVFNSYRNRINNSTNSNARSRGSILSKVKGFFNNASANSSLNEIANTTTTTEQQTTHNNHNQFKIPGGFDTSFANETVINAPPSNDNDVQSSPSKLLSDFFKEKGDKPLTKIEYEGVLSLIAKTKNTKPEDKTINNNDSDFTNLLNDKSLLIHPSNTTQNNSILLDSPKQRYLKRNNPDATSMIDTPEYTPVYHTFANNSFNNSFSTANKTMPSIKRVYQFSGLPSPYRTRIRVPSASSSGLRPSVKRHKKKTTANTTEKEDISLANTTFQEKNYKPYKPRSEAANTLLSILDGKLTYTQKEDIIEPKIDVEPKIEEVKVPIIKESSTTTTTKNNQNNNNNTNGISITAKDIAKTILFDKSEPLAFEKTDKIEKKDNSILNGTTSSNAFNFSSNSGNFSFNAKPTVESNTKIEPPQPIIPPPKIENTKPIPEVKVGSSFNFQPPPTVKQTNNNFGFGITNSNTNSSITKPDNNNDFGSYYKFPDVEIVNVQLDGSKVDKYKNLFEF
ncbi:hypothetical protein DFJ63DRAFT_122678 [Scheffersomyces coipomensis]|uniref:uncharacterized protein n=1 Tax=Scheffersomyces coipomensis TaxID=1788519 RepID=UPI00315DEFB0